MTQLAKELSMKYGIEVIDRTDNLNKVINVNENCDDCHAKGYVELFRGQLEDMVCEVVVCPECN